jgi:peptidoglycan/xylan/chitin deacetylase (PgdA/CDA1 family)
MVNRRITLLSIIILLLAGNIVFAKPVKYKVIYIKLRLNSTAPVKVKLAPLKYNKHLAFSFTLDDGYRSAFTCAYPLLNGGTVSSSIPDEYYNNQGGDGQYSPGLFYSDGCGNKIPFKLAVAINGGIVYDHPENRARLSWPEVKQLYQSGWDLLNHGYHHLSKHGTDYYSEVVQNIAIIQQQLGFTMTQFVVPGGEHDAGYEHEYEKDAFKTGAFAVASYVGKGPAIPVDKPVDPTNLIYARDFIQSNKDSVNLPAIDKQLSKLDSLMNLPQPTWYNQFTHSVGDRNLWNLSLLYPEFKYYMTAINQKYGSAGTDNIWMAPWQEVYEYIWLRDRTKISIRQHGKTATIKLELPEIPVNFRYAALSLQVIANSTFEAEASAIKLSTNGKRQHNLINVSLK